MGKTRPKDSAAIYYRRDELILTSYGIRTKTIVLYFIGSYQNFLSLIEIFIFLFGLCVITFVKKCDVKNCNVNEILHIYIHDIIELT